MGEERRKAQRVRAYRPVRLHQPSSPHVVETLTKDLGPGGLRCISPSLFPVSTELDVEVILSRGEEPFIVRGRTMWFRMIPQSEQFDLGIAFTDLTEQKKRRLSSYIDRISSQLTLNPI